MRMMFEKRRLHQGYNGIKNLLTIVAVSFKNGLLLPWFSSQFHYRLTSIKWTTKCLQKNVQNLFQHISKKFAEEH